ncbi:chemotaxis protein CheW [Salipiger mucosus]|uniref:Positive regulator of CheA protein activity (CheW) n=1 Tax=Salipiger mucosus DSM 16094 TaxID=1123237 RepID=S9QGF1_9RHOB|nr:chemotaxis protein CheW [Salipiger mucosus]EPX78653.1 Positive regulator of CheA protein activity (CheW) [Salipiger mucosus DSM 16094]
MMSATTERRPPAGMPSHARRNRTMVTLSLGAELVAISTAILREVIEPGTITRVPNAPGFASGLINVRGMVVPLTDLRIPLRMPIRPPNADTRILVLDLMLDGAPSVVGILAEQVHEVTDVTGAALEDVPSVGTRWPRHLVEAIGRKNDRFFIIPDLDGIFSTHLSGFELPALQP